MTQLTLDCYDKINIPDEERVLYAPEGTTEFVEDVPKYEEEESCFTVRFRSNQFCNQYLMVARTEQDDEDTLDTRDVEQTVKELKQ